MNIANQLPAPLNSFVIDVPANQYYDFGVEAGSSYPLKGVVYPVDYGNVPGYTTEDDGELDLFVGNDSVGKVGYVYVRRGVDIPDEHKFYVGLSEAEVDAVLSQLKPVLIEHGVYEGLPKLLSEIERFRNK